MGLLDVFSIDHSATQKTSVEAAVNVLPEAYSNVYYPAGFPYATRAQAMSIPSFARARNIICGTIGGMPIEAYNKTTREHIYGNKLLEQPDPSMPRAVSIAWTIEDLLLTGLAFWQVLATDPQSGRPVQARRIEPQRVSFNTQSATNDTITEFYVDGSPVPMIGVGSIILFTSYDEGVLARAGLSIKTAYDLEMAASNVAKEPVPTGILKNTGADLPADQVTGILAAWKSARASRSTAYLNSAIDFQPQQFDPASMQLVEARKYTTEIISHLVGIPSYYLNADTASNTYSNTIQERRNLVDFSLKPLISVVEQRLSMDDITPVTQEVRFDLDDYLRGNPIEQIDVIGKMLELNLINEDEARAMMDLAPRGMNA